MVKDISKSILAVDFGSTTTKARLFVYNGDWSLYETGEAPTTVEAPHLDVTVGLENALKQIELKKGLKIISDQKILLDHFYATSSAGGGLQVIILAPTKEISGIKAEKAAMLAGAIVQRILTLDSAIDETNIIMEISELKPDIIIIVGGFSGTSSGYVEKLSELAIAASPKPRFGYNTKIPVIVAGSELSNETAQKILEREFEVYTLPNLSPSEFVINSKPLTLAIHDIFIEHVMSNAPGYNKVLEIVSAPPLATPIAAGQMIEFCSKTLNTSILAVDIGGATTDIFSCDRGGINFLRTVSANYGMSFSSANVLYDAISILKTDISTNTHLSLLDKMLRPNSLPISQTELKKEMFLAKLALRLSLKQHQSFFNKPVMPSVIIGSGGVISHSPSIYMASEILIDGFQPVGIVELVADNLFLLPHLGVLSQHHPDAAAKLFLTQCIKPLCVYVKPSYFIPFGLNSNRVLAEVIVNSKYVFELRASKRIFFTIPEDIKDIKIKNRWGTIFDKVSTQTAFSGIKTICLDGLQEVLIHDCTT